MQKNRPTILIWKIKYINKWTTFDPKTIKKLYFYNDVIEMF